MGIRGHNGEVSVRVVILSLAAVASATVGATLPAQADSTVVVRGTDFPDPGAWLSFVGCAALYDRTEEPLQPFVGLGPGVAPAGQRSLGYDLAGGNAMGSLLTVASMTGTSTAAMAVNAPDGAAGVAYAGYRAPGDEGTAEVWFGRADLQVTPGAWQDVEATGLDYTWTKYDMTTGLAVLAGPASALTVTDFATSQGGDGPGLYTIGFGCDGAAFHMDALRVGTPGDVTTYDLEGLQTTTGISSGSSPSSAVITAGDAIDLHGSLDVVAGATSVPHATLLLERRPFGSQEWETIEVVDADSPQVAVRPSRRTSYRWRFVERPLAEASRSTSFVVDVAPRLTARSEGGRLVGVATPTRAGTPLTLWRDESFGPVAVSRGQVGDDGAWSLPLPQGGGRFFVTLPAAEGNLAATSPVVVVEPSAGPTDPAEAGAPAPSGPAPAEPTPSSAGQASLAPLLAPSPSPLTPSPSGGGQPSLGGPVGGTTPGPAATPSQAPVTYAPAL